MSGSEICGIMPTAERLRDDVIYGGVSITIWVRVAIQLFAAQLANPSITLEDSHLDTLGNPGTRRPKPLDRVA